MSEVTAKHPSPAPESRDSQMRCHEFELALSITVDAVFTTDAADRITYLNAAAEALTGWHLSEAVGKPLNHVFFLVFKDDHPQPVGARDEAAARSPMRPPVRHAALVNRRGIEIGIEYRIVSLHDDRGRVAGSVVVCHDTSRRHAAELALQTSNESLLANADALFEEKERAQVTLNSIGDAVISTNFSGRVSYLNIVAEKMTGWVQTEAAGAEIDEIFRLVDANTHEMIPCPTTRAIIENRTVSLETVCVLSRRDGDQMAVEVSAAPIHDRNGGVIGAVMVAHDVTVARELSSKLARLALHDSLTDLPNRALFSERLSQAMANARVNAGFAALLYVDLDRFKHINDSLGHAVGDKLLQTVARRLLGCVRSTDTVSRQGGDEFVVVLPDIARAKDAGACADKILVALDAPYRIGEHELRVSASIGLAIFPDDAADVDTLLRCADFAMYQAKYDGRNNYKYFRAEAKSAAGAKIAVDAATAGDAAMSADVTVAT